MFNLGSELTDTSTVYSVALSRRRSKKWNSPLSNLICRYENALSCFHEHQWDGLVRGKIDSISVLCFTCTFRNTESTWSLLSLFTNTLYWTYSIKYSLYLKMSVKTFKILVCRLALRLKYPKFGTEGFTALYTRWKKN